jgi:ribonuclease HI
MLSGGTGMAVVVHVDGLCEPVNPNGVACYGYVIYGDGEKLEEGCGVVDYPSSSNNVAEYTACIKALERLIELGLTEDVLVRSDSQLLIYQLKGFYTVKAARIIPLYEKVTTLIKQFKRIRFEWVPREENEEADELSRRAYYDYVSKNLATFLEKYKKYLATEKQRAFLARLGISCPPWLSKREASKLISEALSKRR